MHSRIESLLPLKKKLIIFVIAIAVVLGGCASDEQRQATIITSHYPFYFLASELVGQDVEVINITPVGASAHDFELSPNEMIEFLGADLAILLGSGFQPAIEEAAKSRNEPTIIVMHELGFDEQDSDSIDDHNHDHDHEHDHGENDPHIWLDPVLMKDVVETIAEGIIAINKNLKTTIEANSEKLISQLEQLDDEYRRTLESCEIDTFVTSHDAFSRLANRYNLVQEPIAGFSPENEPTPRRMNEIINLVQARDIDTIFSEELVSKRVADSLRTQANVQVKLLSPLESLTQTQIDDNQNYFSIMRSNLANLSKALKCDQVSR